MAHLGDFATGVTLDTKFTTVTTTGAPTTLAGTPAISVYKDNSATQSTSGVTLSVDFDTVTGLNNVRVDTSSDGTFYSAGSNFQVVITTGTVGGTSVVGYVVAEFSLANRSALRPTTAGRTLDVSAGGEAGVDWANVGSPTTTLDLSGTTVATTQKVDVNTVKTQAVTCAAGVTVLASVGTASTSTAQTGDAYARLGAPAGASVSADVAAVKSDSAAILDDTGTSGVLLASAYDFAKGTVAMTESYATDGAAMTPAQAIHQIWAMLAEANASGTTITVKKLDGSTTAMTFTIDDATTPTSITRAT